MLPAAAPAGPAAAAAQPGAQSGSALLKSALTKVQLAAACQSTSDDGGALIGAFRAAAPAAAGASNSCDGAAAAGSDGGSATDGASGAGAPAPPAAAAPSPAAAAAAATARARGHTKLLALCPTVPPSMQRDCWCMADYEVLEKLYTGYASKVYKAICKRTREVVVLKSYQLSAICELYQHQIFREVGLHASLCHENVVTLYAAFQEGDFVVMVQEFADGGDLFSLLQKYGGRLSERVTVSLVLEPFLRVLQYLHTRGIVHRDIKPENILFTSGMCLKLADFGLAIDLRQERAVTRAGTLDYMAPEVLNCPYKNRPEENKDKPHLHYSATVDSWAVGVLAYELLVGCPPFYDAARDRVEARIRAAAPAFPRSLTDDARSFVSGALTKDPIERPTVLQLLHHPWVDTFRARRSMRQLAPPAAQAALAAGAEAGDDGAAGAPRAARPGKAAPAPAPAPAPGALAGALLAPPPAAKAAGAPALQPAPTAKYIGGTTPSALQAIEAGITAPPPRAAPAAPAAAYASAHAREDLRVQASAQSTPLMVSGDLRGLGLAGASAALPPAERDGERQRAKWLQGIRLWPNGK